jgi:hypothetical protein
MDVIDLAELLDVHDIGMADLRADPCLVDNHIDEARLNQIRIDHLERDEPRNQPPWRRARYSVAIAPVRSRRTIS